MILNTSTWQRPTLADEHEIQTRVGAMLNDIRERGDIAITEYSERFDRFAPEIIELKPFVDYQLAPALAEAIKLAATRIERFAKKQRDSLTEMQFSDEFGEYGQRLVPIENMAAYIPGGRFPLISTALMTLIPARIAGCVSRVALSPSDHPALLAAASLAGATKFVRIGGAQAIAAAAYGCKWLSAVDMIVGPGNAYVTEAKAQLQSRVRIDTVAGPSEVLILADGKQNVAWLLEDAIAQAEHGPDALAVVASNDRQWLQMFEQSLQKNESARALAERQQIQLVFAETKADLIEFANRFGAEHLMLCHEGIGVETIRHAGAVFIGARSPVALGDYLSGPNHTLPTVASARRSSGLSVLDFLRVQTVQTIRNGSVLYQAAAEIAEAEGLQHHARSLRLRMP